MDVMGAPLRLVIKSSNQQCDDHIVECELDWTVRRLKSYLAEFYPSKPKIEEQKLIYSGQLLHDHVLLKDVLRWYETGTPAVHTVHLVYVAPTDSQPVKSARKTNLYETVSPGPSSSMSANPTIPTLPLNLQMDGLRQRTNTPEMSGGASRSFVVGNAYGGADISPPAFNVHPMMGQMMYMQHMYAQYMNQYMLQYYRGAGMHQTMTVPPETGAVVGSAPLTNANDEPGVAPAPEPRQIDDRLNAAAAVPPVNDDDDNAAANRDWLDWFYMLSRSAVLLAIIYFYSSLSRFIAVIIIATALYLYQLGWFPAERHHNNNNHLNVNNNNRQAEEEQEHVDERRPADEDGPQADPPAVVAEESIAPEIVDEDQMRRETREIEEMMDHENDNELPQNIQTSVVSVAWTFITSFFASIIPEQPGPVNV